MNLFALFTAALAGEASFHDASPQLDGISLQSFTVGGAGYSGVAPLDYDLDGDLDLYFGNGPTRDNPLLRNDGSGHFEEVARESGDAWIGTGTGGVLAADLDGDGYPDLVLPGDRAPQRVLGNNADGTFTDVTLFSGLEGARRNVAAQAADIDLDGDLDVFIGGGIVPLEIYPNTLWRNNGDYTFNDIAVEAGLATNSGYCAGRFTYIDDDAFIDLLVATCNDLDLVLTPFEVFRNKGDGTFESAYESSRIWQIGHFMTFAALDYDGDALMDFFSTNVGTLVERDGPHVLYRAVGDGSYEEVAAAAGVSDLAYGWGAVAADFDNDGWEDLYYVGKAHLDDGAESPGNLMMNRGDGTFAPPTVPYDLSGQYTSGVAAADVDGNGFVDLIIPVTENYGGDVPGLPVLLINDGNDNHWITLRLHGSDLNTAAIGARIWVSSPGRRQIREIDAGASYLSTNSPWVHVGLGIAVEATACIRWPDGSYEDFGAVTKDLLTDLAQGDGVDVENCDAVEETTGTLPTTTPEGHTDNPKNPTPSCGCQAEGQNASVTPGLLLFMAWRRRSNTRRPPLAWNHPRCTN